MKDHEELMSTFSTNISQVCRKLRQIRGEHSKSLDLPFIETLNGKYSGNNIFFAPTQKHFAILM